MNADGRGPSQAERLGFGDEKSSLPLAGDVAFIGNALPRRCGIATFTTHLTEAIAEAQRRGGGPRRETCIVAMNDHAQSYAYPATVRHEVRDDLVAEYAQAAAFLNARQPDVVCLQHEFGIFGGPAGSHVLDLINRLTMPVVTTLHTVLDAPSPAQRGVLERIIETSARVVVMAEKGRALLQSVYGAPAGKIEVIPHGVPEMEFVDPEPTKARLGFAGRQVILTFGLLSPNKGVEVVIDAMPLILRTCPTAVYVVLGATHPNLVRSEGEAYRESLMARAHALGVGGHVVLVDGFMAQERLLDFIAMADLYVTPYLTAGQMTSGTLAYSFGLGKAVVSTPYWHASELLANGNGALVPFNDAPATGQAIATLLGDDALREAMRRRAYAASRAMTWPRTAERYLATFEVVRAEHAGRQRARRRHALAAALPAVRLGHLGAMCDDTGLLQHAIHTVPDRNHGYCIDDNARALLLACMLTDAGETALPEALPPRFAGFLQHAFNPATGRFRNFMGFNRTWLEEQGSDDSHGRALWALGVCAARTADPPGRAWAARLFRAGLPVVAGFLSPRAWGFTLLGLAEYCAATPGDHDAAALQHVLADRLLARLAAAQAAGWIWFEDRLAYDNARLAQALIATGAATGRRDLATAGLAALRWLVAMQTAPGGYFRPVGSAGIAASGCFADPIRAPRRFDQQALEAAATVSACLAAWRLDGDPAWRRSARQAFDWFLGVNDLALMLADTRTGGCRDGLHPDRANENQGAESVLSYLLSLVEMRHAARDAGDLPATARLHAVGNRLPSAETVLQALGD